MSKDRGGKKIAAGRYKTLKKILTKQQKKKKEGTKKWADYPVVGWEQEGKAVPDSGFCLELSRSFLFSLPLYHD